MTLEANSRSNLVAYNQLIFLDWRGATSESDVLLLDIINRSRQAQEFLDTNEEARISKEEPGTKSPKPPPKPAANKDQHKILTIRKGSWTELDIKLLSLFWSRFSAVLSLLSFFQCGLGLINFWLSGFRGIYIFRCMISTAIIVTKSPLALLFNFGITFGDFWGTKRVIKCSPNSVPRTTSFSG